MHKEAIHTIPAEAIPHVVSTDYMETQAGTTAELRQRHHIVELLGEKGLGYDIFKIMSGVKEATTEGVIGLSELCAILESDWEHTQASIREITSIKGTETTPHGLTSLRVRARATAGIYNNYAKAARELQEGPLQPFHTLPLRQLASGIKEAIHQEKASGVLPIHELAELVLDTAQARTHWDTWAFRPLPRQQFDTYIQPYTSVGLFSVNGDAADLPTTYVTNFATFYPGMHAHMHGVSGAFEALNGLPGQTNHKTVNYIFSLIPENERVGLHVELENDCSNDAVIYIPPKFVHSVVPSYTSSSKYHPSIEDMIENPELKQEVINTAQFGLRSSTLVFLPDRRVVEEARRIGEDNIWKTMGTLAVNRINGKLYYTNLHAMETRWHEFTLQGECCGMCWQQDIDVPHSSRHIYVEDELKRPVSYEEASQWIDIPRHGETLPVWTRDSHTGLLVSNGVINERYMVEALAV